MAVMTTPLFLLEVQGYGRLYGEIENSFNGNFIILLEKTPLLQIKK